MHGWCEKDPLDPTEQTLQPRNLDGIKEHSTEMHHKAHLMHQLSILIQYHPYLNSYIMIEYTKISHSELLHTKSTKDPTRSQEQTYKNLGHRKRPRSSPFRSYHSTSPHTCTTLFNKVV